MLEDGYYGTVVTEVQVTRSDVSRNNAATTHSATPAILPPKPKRAYMPGASFDGCTVAMDDLDFSKVEEGGSATVFSANRYAATVTTTAQDAKEPQADTLVSRIDVLWDAVKSFAGKFGVHDKIKSAYLRTSFLFALSVLVTWIPSSMNRIRSWTSGESPFEFHVATAAVLPLQGLWNTIIFFVTSSGAFSKSWADLSQRYAAKGGGLAGLLAALNTTRAATEGAQAARNDPTKFSNDGGIGLTMSRRNVPTCDDDLADSISEGDTNSLDSHVELRRMAEAPGKHMSSESL